jgi:GntR family transcriptional regulator/MocR family aminotransferase
MRNSLSGLIDLNRGNAAPLARQLCEQLRAAIASGRLSSGQKLPSSRMLAEWLKVSRNTISAAINQLSAEGYLNISRGRRPLIADGVARSLISRRTVEPRRPAAAHRLSKWGQRVIQSNWPFTREGIPRPFLPGLADVREFPHDIWARCLRRAARSTLARCVTAHNRPALQEALVTHLIEHRGVKAEARQIMITPSAQAAIELIARVILEAGDIAWVESPGYGGARVALQTAGARVSGVRLDHCGLTFEGRKDCPRLIFVTPSHQYPTGRLMPIGRRLELLRFAVSVGAVLIEDDYDSEFQFDGRPIAALQGLDGSGQVFYVGTFSKSMLPDIRVGYALVPDSLVETFELAQRHTGHIVSAPLQDALSEFMNDGTYVAHIRRMTRVYRARRDRLLQALASEAGDAFLIEPPAGGMQLLARYHGQYDDRAISARLAQAGVIARPLSMHFIGSITEQGLFLGFAAWNDKEIEAGVSIVRRVVREVFSITFGRSGPRPRCLSI